MLPKGRVTVQGATVVFGILNCTRDLLFKKVTKVDKGNETKAL